MPAGPPCAPWRVPRWLARFGRLPQSRNAVAAENKQIDAENEQISQDNCAQAQARRQRYTDARRLYRPTEDGGREYLTSEELEAEWADADVLVKKWCGRQ